MPAVDVAKIVAEAVGLAVLLLAVGRWAGSVSSALREIQTNQGRHGSITEALGRKLDADRERNASDHTRLWMASTQTVGRVETLERLAGLPPPWKRTQPIQPVDPNAPPPQDVFRPEDEQP